MKIKSPIGFLALWSAFLAAGSWIIPLGVVSGLSIQSTSVATLVPIEVEEVPLVVVLTTDSCAESGDDLAMKLAEQAGLHPNDADVVRVQVSPDLAQQLAVEAVAAGGLQGENPVDGDGKALPPPLQLPPLPNGEPRKWKPVQGTPGRPIKWIPNIPLPPPPPPTPGGGQPGGSWDPEHDHFDVDDGLGNRVRIKPDGTTVDDNHLPVPNLPLPPRFPGIDLDITAQFHCVTVVTITVGLGGIILLIIFKVCSGAALG